ncbi:MAG: cation-transporting P-type ATPase [Desulfonatronovibrionaceae bacterium]
MAAEHNFDQTRTWHAVPAEEALHLLRTDPGGLDPDQAAARLREMGPNALAEVRKKGPLSRFIKQFHNVLIYVLLAAAIITAFLQEWLDSAVIFGVTLINAVIGFIQEGKAEKSLDSIKNMLAPRAVVMRGGRKENIPADEIVPGDIVLLKAGDKVPADIRILDAWDLQIDESALTGESVPVSKAKYEVSEEAALGDRTSMAFSGTLVTYGQGTGVTAATGRHTQIGRISSMLSQVDTLTTPLLRQIARFGHFLTGAILILAGITFIFGILSRGYNATEMFMASVGLAVAAIPEGLPAIMTITLAIGVQRMARRNAIIRRLPAVETLGSVTVICSDKTGTLTKNQMTVQYVRTADHLLEVSGAGYSPEGGFSINSKEINPSDYPVLNTLLASAVLCNDAVLQKTEQGWHLEGAPTEGALITAAIKAGLDVDRLSAENPRLDVRPFSSENKFMATLNSMNRDRLIILKGAPEKVLERCSLERHQDQDHQLDREFWNKQGELIASQGQRLLALAVKQTEQETISPEDLNHGFVLLGLFGIIDPPRQEAVEAAARLIGRCVAVQECHSAGIQVKMITGDHALTAVSIAEKLGIGDGNSVLTGRELENMDDAELQKAAPQVDVFARTSPEHKLRLVKALQAENHTVAMTGDGVNDAPALKRADVGVAMGRSGTEAAKEASDMVLADDNFASIASAVEEGRTVYDNLKKAILFILPTNGGQALVVMASIFLGIGSLDAAGHFLLPITPPQILWINMVTAVSLALALAFEPAEANVMKRPPRSPEQGLISGFLLWRGSFVALLLVVGALGHYQYMLTSGASRHLASTAAINTLVMGQVFYLFNSRFILESSWNIKALTGSRPVLASIAVLVVLQLAFTYLPALQYAFQTQGLDAWAWLRIGIFGFCLFTLVELEKRLFRRYKK